MSEPSPNGDNGRDAGGKFVRGNAGGPGNPFSKKSAEVRAALYAAVDPEQMRRIWSKYFDECERNGLNQVAVYFLKDVLDRLIGISDKEQSLILMQEICERLGIEFDASGKVVRG